MLGWLILALAVGAFLPVIVAAVVAFLALTRGGRADMGMALAFAKGVIYGAAGGATVSGVVVGLALLLKRLV